MIEITNVNLKEFAKKVYELSAPQGLGFLQPYGTLLEDGYIEEHLKSYEDDKRFALNMDYCNGRACKMTVFKKDGKLEICDNWYDHTDEQFDKLLKTFGIEIEHHKKHNISCNCIKCRIKRK
jgi:hypothetical protein